MRKIRISAWGVFRIIVAWVMVDSAFFNRSLLNPGYIATLISILVGSYVVQCMLGQKPKSDLDYRMDYVKKTTDDALKWLEEDSARWRNLAAKKREQENNARSYKNGQNNDL